MQKKDRTKIKQIIKDASIKLRLTEHQTIELVMEKTPGVKISSKTFYNIKKEIKEENKEWFDSLALSRYGYLEQYNDLIETEKLATKKSWEIIDNEETTASEKTAAIGKIYEIVNTIKSIYQYMPQILLNQSGLPIIGNDNENKNNEPYDISKDPQAKF